MDDQNHPASEVDVHQEELVAYLDGELGAEAGRRVEERLAEDEPYRRRMQQLDEAWQLLDYLPRATVDQSFTNTTVEMVALAAAQDAGKWEPTPVGRPMLARLAACGSFLAAAACGYFLVTALVSRPNDRLVRDLPVIENIDLYLHAGSVDFLRKLDEDGLFAEEVDDAL